VLECRSPSCTCTSISFLTRFMVCSANRRIHYNPGSCKLIVCFD
jgi:hypothetical protein